MTRPRLFVAAAIAIAGAASWHVWNVWRFAPLASSEPGDERSVRGAIHVHSNRSDGVGSLDAIATAARRAGLDFVVLTDHQDLEALGTDEYRDGVLIIKGVEISTRSGHVLALGIERPEFQFDGDLDTVLSDIDALGGFAVIAHPGSRRPGQTWTDPRDVAVAGIEVLNAASDVPADRRRAAAGAMSVFVNARYGLLRALSTNPSAFALWDKLSANVTPVAGADAHGGIRVGERVLPFPDYEAVFTLFSNYVLLESPLSGDAVVDAARVLESLRSGRSFVAVDAAADASGFSMRLDRDALDVSTGVDASRIVLLRDGAPVASRHGARWSGRLDEPGRYRVEVFLEDASPLSASIPWIVSSHVDIGHPAREPVRNAPPVVPEDGTPYRFDAWETRADPTSRAGAPEISGDAVTFEFSMGDSMPAERRSFCELLAIPASSMHGARGMSFSYRASGVFRFDVQLRDRNPNAADGVEPWRQSVKTATEWRRTYVPFDELHSYAPASDGRFDPDDAVAVGFHLDTATVRPGVSGRIWIRELRLHPRR